MHGPVSLRQAVIIGWNICSVLYTVASEITGKASINVVLIVLIVPLSRILCHWVECTFDVKSHLAHKPRPTFILPYPAGL